MCLSCYQKDRVGKLKECVDCKKKRSIPDGSVVCRHCSGLQIKTLKKIKKAQANKLASDFSYASECDSESAKTETVIEEEPPMQKSQ